MVEVTTLLAKQLADDQRPIDALESMLREEDPELIDVVHVFDHRGRFVGRWVHADLLTTDEYSAATAGGAWHNHESCTGWAWLPESERQ